MDIPPRIVPASIACIIRARINPATLISAVAPRNESRLHNATHKCNFKFETTLTFSSLGDIISILKLFEMRYNMREAYFRFMSAVDIDCYKSIRESEIGSTLPYSDVLQLFIINHKQNMTVSELADRLNLSRPATTQKVNELANKGLVIKTGSTEDKRVTYLSLADSLVQNSNDAKSASLMDAVDENFSEDKKAVFSEILNFMADYLSIND